MSDPTRHAIDPSGQAADRLESWKEIAAYLKRDVRTAQRWEKHDGLPVHRYANGKIGGVYAFAGELDAWRQPATERSEQTEAKLTWVNRSTVFAATLAALSIVIAAVLWIGRGS